MRAQTSHTPIEALKPERTVCRGSLGRAQTSHTPIEALKLSPPT